MRRQLFGAIAVIIILVLGAAGAYYAWGGGKEKFPIGGFLGFGRGSDAAQQSSESGIPIPPQTPVYDPAQLTKVYEHPSYSFAFRYPEDYSPSSFPNPAFEDGTLTGETIVIQNGAGGGFQIVVSPFDEPGNVLTEERIKADIPDLSISEVQAVELGASGKGLAFKSDNEAFAGSSREVWFVFRGNLYQISTYLSQDSLLQAVMGTWEFR